MFFKLVIHSTSGETNSDMKFFTALEGSQFLEKLGCLVIKNTSGEAVYSSDVMIGGGSVADAFAESEGSLFQDLWTPVNNASQFNNLNGDHHNPPTSPELPLVGFIPVRFEVIPEWV